jgi:hypothetical protein
MVREVVIIRKSYTWLTTSTVGSGILFALISQSISKREE